MIIIAIVALSGVVLTLLFATLVGFPSLPSQVMVLWNRLLTYIGQGVGFFYGFVYVQAVKPMIRVTIAVEAIVLSYKFVMWVAKKIPMFGVSD